MRSSQKLQTTVLLTCLCLPAAIAQTSATTAAAPSPATKKHAHKPTQQELAIEEMNAKYAALENRVNTQLNQMQQKLDDRDHQLKQAQDAATAAQADAAKAVQQLQAVVGDNNQQVSSLQNAVTDLKTNSATLTATLQSDEKATKALQHPDTIHFKGVELKPGGFLAAETVWRRRGIGGDVNTQFTGIPFAGQSAGDLSEFNASGRQSRIALLAEGKLQNGDTLRGYYEADFLSAGVTSNDNQSNSYTMRQRQVWAQAALGGGLNITGGQMWSLATEYKSGLKNSSEYIPLTIDAQYNAGFSWERQYGFRVTKDIGQHFFLGGALEEAQTLNIAGHNLPPLLYQQAGNTGGLYNSVANYSYNEFPDVIGKLAYEPGHGLGHYEVFALARFFRDRVFPDVCWSTSGSSPISSTSCAKASGFPVLETAQGAYDSKTHGGGIGANAYITVLKKVDLAGHILAGDGVGRYGSSTLSDVTAHPDGSLEPLKGGSVLGRIEYHPAKRWDVYAYYGGDYVERQYYLNPAGKLTGYGAPTNVTSGCYLEVAPAASANGGGNVPGSAANCTADNRNIQEGTLGYWYRFYRGEHGMLQQGFQFSYVVRNTWLGVGGAPKAVDDMWFTSFRYYLPQ